MAEKTNAETEDLEEIEETTPTTPETKKKPLSSDIVNSTLGKTIKGLQTKISSLEDRLTASEEKNADYETRFAVLAKTPSKTPSKSMLDELEEFLGGNPFDGFKRSTFDGSKPEDKKGK